MASLRGVTITNADGQHGSQVLTSGLNIEVKDKSIYDVLEPRYKDGIYVASSEDHAHLLLHQCTAAALLWNADIRPPANTRAYTIGTRTSRVFLSNPRPIPATVWSAALRHDTYAIQYIPQSHMNLDTCASIVEKNGRLIRYMPQPIAKQLYLAAVLQTGWALQFVPEDERVMQLCIAAVQQSGWALQFVPPTLVTLAVCTAAVRTSGMALQFVPLVHRNPDVCEIATEQNGYSLRFVPKRSMCDAVCMAAVKMDGMTLKLVPAVHQTRDVCAAAVRQNKRAKKYVL